MHKFYCGQMINAQNMRIISSAHPIIEAYNGPIVWHVWIIVLITIQFISMIVEM